VTITGGAGWLSLAAPVARLVRGQFIVLREREFVR
jgi:ABC-type dipeptide/oligopeptide/nickel transport system permease subunit